MKRWIPALVLTSILLNAADKVVVHDPRLKLEEFAVSPDIVTPIGIAFDHKNRLMVIESHTHFRPNNYKGPPADRIRILEDTNNDGKADKFTTFFEGTSSTMSIAKGPDNWMYVATRMKVFRIRDKDGDGVAEEQTDVVKMETKGNYPHNGLSGLCFDNHGKLLFGLGENLGEAYKLTGTDGKELTGGGEGGNIYRCNPDGSQLERIATGVWNPFGIKIDANDRIFCVDNDPDGCPPCRMIQVVETGDYGFEFRYGRSGKHPLQAWNGELPGTLPMVTGTGEAPCDILFCDGKLWVTSWGENRIERFGLQPNGASFTAARDVVVEGDDNFRPVAFARAPDGSIYFTDWVSRSYNLHGKGRVWHLTWNAAPADATKPMSETEQQAKKAAENFDLESLKSADPFIRQAAVSALTKSKQLDEIKFADLKDSNQRLGYLQAARWRGVPEEVQRGIIKAALSDDDPNVRIFAIRWISDAKLKEFRAELDSQLLWPKAPVKLCEAVFGAADWLDGAYANGETIRRQKKLSEILADETKPASLRALALRLLPLNSPAIAPEKLKPFLSSTDATLQQDAMRALALSPSAAKFPILAESAADEKLPPEVRAIAVMALAEKPAENADLLNKLASDPAAPVKAEAERAKGDATRAAAEKKPAIENVDSWLPLVGEGGNAQAGWRTFFSAKGPGCYKCHACEGRGASVGPDLTKIVKSMGRHRVLESILQPSKEIAPQFVPWLIKTTDGKVFTGFPADGPQGDSQKFIGADGNVFSIKNNMIESKTAQKTSIMPEGLERAMTLEELRDLLAFLSGN